MDLDKYKDKWMFSEDRTQQIVELVKKRLSLKTCRVLFDGKEVSFSDFMKAQKNYMDEGLYKVACENLFSVIVQLESTLDSIKAEMQNAIANTLFTKEEMEKLFLELRERYENLKADVLRLQEENLNKEKELSKLKEDQHLYKNINERFFKFAEALVDDYVKEIQDASPKDAKALLEYKVSLLRLEQEKVKDFISSYNNAKKQVEEVEKSDEMIVEDKTISSNEFDPDFPPTNDMPLEAMDIKLWNECVQKVVTEEVMSRKTTRSKLARNQILRRMIIIRAKEEYTK